MSLLRVTMAGILLTAIGSNPSDGQCSEREKVKMVGTVEVDDYKGQIFFQDPADDGKSYRVSVAISKPWNTPAIKGERIDVWLLARGGKALAINTQPGGGALIEAGSAGATASAIYFFDRSVKPSELSAVVVSVDGQPKVFKLTAPKKE